MNDEPTLKRHWFNNAKLLCSSHQYFVGSKITWYKYQTTIDFLIIMHSVVSSFCFSWIRMLWVYDCLYICFSSFSEGIDIILTSESHADNRSPRRKGKLSAKLARYPPIFHFGWLQKPLTSNSTVGTTRGTRGNTCGWNGEYFHNKL